MFVDFLSIYIIINSEVIYYFLLILDMLILSFRHLFFFFNCLRMSLQILKNDVGLFYSVHRFGDYILPVLQIGLRFDRLSSCFINFLIFLLLILLLTFGLNNTHYFIQKLSRSVIVVFPIHDKHVFIVSFECMINLLYVRHLNYFILVSNNKY